MAIERWIKKPIKGERAMASDCIDWLIPITLPRMFSPALEEIKLLQSGQAIPEHMMLIPNTAISNDTLFIRAINEVRKAKNKMANSKIFIPLKNLSKNLLKTPDPNAQQTPIKAAIFPISELVN